MNISIFGLGYVGCVSAACLAMDKHSLIGVEVSPKKIEIINSGHSPIVEPDLEEIINQVVNSGHFQVTHDGHGAVHKSDISLICVGTPSNENGSLSLKYVENVCKEIGSALATKEDYHVIVVRSTVLPGTLEEKLIPILEFHSSRKAGVDFGVCMNPEFLREGSAIKDYVNPSLVVIGELDPRSGDRMQELYANIEAPIIRTNIRTAEMVKYTCNAFHALKVVFANEIGNLCKAHQIDGQEVMEYIGRDQQLNISTAYLRPGYAFGGSCLPKDLRALVHRAKERDVDCDLLDSIMSSNRKQIELGVKLVERTGFKKVGILGLSFKARTDDLRESPAITLVETLVGRGYKVHVFDKNVQLSRLIGANKSFLEKELPHIASLLCSSIDDVLSRSEVIVITNGSENFRQVRQNLDEHKILIDLDGIAKGIDDNYGNYEGICW